MRAIHRRFRARGRTRRLACRSSLSRCGLLEASDMNRRSNGSPLFWRDSSREIRRRAGAATSVSEVGRRRGVRPVPMRYREFKSRPPAEDPSVKWSDVIGTVFGFDWFHCCFTGVRQKLPSAQTRY